MVGSTFACCRDILFFHCLLDKHSSTVIYLLLIHFHVKSSPLILRAFLSRPLGALLSQHKPESRSVLLVAEAKWRNSHAAPPPLIYAGSFRRKKERGLVSQQQDLNKNEGKVIILK